MPSERMVVASSTGSLYRKRVFRSRRRRHRQALQDLSGRWDERSRGRRKGSAEARPVFRTARRVADRRRHAFSEDRVGKLRRQRASGGQTICSERFLVSAEQASWLRSFRSATPAGCSAGWPRGSRTGIDSQSHCIDSGSLRKSLLSSARISNAQSCTWSSCSRLFRALKVRDAVGAEHDRVAAGLLLLQIENVGDQVDSALESTKSGIWLWFECRKTFSEMPVVDGWSAMLWKLAGSALSSSVVGITRWQELQSLLATARPEAGSASGASARKVNCTVDNTATMMPGIHRM